METQIFRPNKSNIEICKNALLSDKLVAFPTETVYGLGANALSEAAVKKIYEAKGRPSDNPLIVHLGDKKSIESYAEITKNAHLLIDAYMPGPITLVLKKKPCIPDIVTGGRDTVGIRIPDSEVAISFLRECNVPVCAPSANTSTRPSPTTAQHVFDDLEGKIGYILDGGSCDIGIESTIVDVSSDKPVLLRKGGISKEQIESVLGISISVLDSSDQALCPGLKYKHYSPKARVMMVRDSELTQQQINDIFNKQSSMGCKVRIICYNKDVPLFPQHCCEGMGDTIEDYARNYYASLRKLDKEGVDVIITWAPKESGIGYALYNRMLKSAGGEVYMEEAKDVSKSAQTNKENITSTPQKKVANKANKEHKNPKATKLILFVCTGNTCRSAMAEMIFKHYLKKKRKQKKYTVLSGGLAVYEDDMNIYAKQALERKGIEFEKHIPSQLDGLFVQAATRVICMEQGHKDAITSVLGQLEKIKTVDEITKQGNISDPYGKTPECYDEVVDRLIDMSEHLLKDLEGKQTSKNKAKAR